MLDQEEFCGPGYVHPWPSGQDIMTEEDKAHGLVAPERTSHEAAHMG